MADPYRALHPAQFEVTDRLVAELVSSQFPEWSALGLKRVESSGTVNAIFRLGDDLCVRLPLTAEYEASLKKEAAWLSILEPQLPLEVPEVVAVGEPTTHYPASWAVLRWIEGANPSTGQLDQASWAEALADFVRALRSVDPAGAPTEGYRGHPLADRDQDTREAITEVGGEFAPGPLVSSWERALETGVGPTRTSWYHGDLHSTNLIERDGRPAAVIDFGGCAVGDPLCDLIPGWWLFDARGRGIFRKALEVDDESWARGRGWALSIALIALPYYRDTNPRFADHARYAIHQVLADQP